VTARSGIGDAPQRQDDVRCVTGRDRSPALAALTVVSHIVEVAMARSKPKGEAVLSNDEFRSRNQRLKGIVRSRGGMAAGKMHGNSNGK